MPETANKLGGETSPYLLQHADNPVHWYPWGEEALTLARELNRPILLSIGYSACHWCHVMAHESFEDAATAALMNRLFVNIKVDREERPDLDRIYQAAHHLLTRRGGGWPLTMFLMPEDHMPFFGGTYFPPEARHGLPGFADILQRVAEYFVERRGDIDEQNTAMAEALAHNLGGPAPAQDEPEPGPLARGREGAAQGFDQRFGGFGQPPKFPHPPLLERLLQHYAASRLDGAADETALRMVVLTLAAMAGGGLQDQLGGGFYRYSTDNEWLIPHFEKMLYDNGALLGLYADAERLFPGQGFGPVAAATAQWLLAEMRSVGGGFCAALDADSGSGEGDFYLWRREEVEALLDADTAAVVLPHYGLEGKPNFEGRWHLHVSESLNALADRLGLPTAEVAARLERGRATLLAERATRERPARDDKVLTGWNGLVIGGLARAAVALDAPHFSEAAVEAVKFLRETHWRDGRLLATSVDGHASLRAYLDDHAFLLAGVLELLQVYWHADLLDFAISLADALLADFQADDGGFWFTAHDHEQLVQRTRTFGDDALPAGNGVAARALGRLGHLLGNTDYLTAAARTLRAGWEPLSGFPSAHNAMLSALEDYLYPPETIILRGEPAAMQPWAERARRHYAPRRMVLAIPADEPAQALPAMLAARTAEGHGVTAWVCRGHHCEAPETDFAAFEAALAAGEVPPIA